MSAAPILSIAVNAPLNRYFDYLCPPGWGAERLAPGVRIRVPFGKKQSIGILTGTSPQSAWPRDRLREPLEILDDHPIVNQPLLRVLQWAADYYHHPPGEVFAAALPTLLRRGADLPATKERLWRPKGAVSKTDLECLARKAPRQAEILEVLAAHPSGAGAETLALVYPRWRAILATLISKGLAEAFEMDSRPPLPACGPAKPGPVLMPQQQEAVDAILADVSAFRCCLLDGVTGSGKTEVYFRVVEQVLELGRQALLLVPEIGLTPQLVQRISRRFHVPVSVMHSGLTDRERLHAWHAAGRGDSRIVVGTRSAVFAALDAPGVIIVDEEHDSSFKQQDGFRYSARDVAVVRGKHEGIPVILGSATPSLESYYNAVTGRYGHLRLPERPGDAKPPPAKLIDLRHHNRRQGLSAPLRSAIRRHLAQQGQVLLYLNRRGYAPTLFCTACGWIAGCGRCDARLTLHAGANRLECHHCGAHRRVTELCPDCHSPLKPVGQGTERIEEVLAKEFPDYPIVRIDRDTIQRRGEIEAALARIRQGEARILVGTQMLTKGHHFPEVTLVGIINADQGLFGADFRSSERLAQTIVQVSGRAGRAHLAGEVFIQTSYPEHPLLQKLIHTGYPGFVDAALEERHVASWPPFSCLALLRAEAARREPAFDFLEAAKRAAEMHRAAGVNILGPAAAPMARRAGRQRAQLLLQSEHRGALHHLLSPWAQEIEGLKEAKRVRWSLDVDPIELF